MRFSLLRTAPTSLLAVLALLGTTTAYAQVTITAAPSGPNPGVAGTGLTGQYYGKPGVGTNAAADAFIGSNAPTATFTATAVDYPQSDATNTVGNGTLLSTFLGTDFGTFSNPALGTNDLNGQLFQFVGFLNITTNLDNNAGLAGIQVLFGLGSDDGSRFNIGTQTVLDNGGVHGFSEPTTTATFNQPGLYAMSIIYYEQGGETGVEFRAQTSPTGGLSIVPTSFLYSSIPTSSAAPEPGTLALLGAALLPGGIAFLRRRRSA
jgi:hypothetical protein